VKVESFGLTDRGLRRHHNEDTFLVRDDLGLFAVSDGMGGHAAGEVAADLTVREVEKIVEATTKSEEDTWPDDWERDLSVRANRLLAAVNAAHRRVTAAVQADSGLKGMGATVVALLLDPAHGQLAIAHVGDSRAYLLRQGELRLLTSDHSWVHEQVLGGLQEPAVDLAEETVQPDDVLLLCSDGLNTMLEDHDIVATLVRMRSLEAAGRELVTEANRRGGMDNITVVLVRLVT
jgi:protein phosphatase